MTRPNPRDLIESAAKDLHGMRDSEETVRESEAVVSIAISLRRIADALWGVPNETDGVIQLLNGIEMSARMRP